MDDIGADEQGADGPVKVIQYVKRRLGPGIAPVGGGFDLVAGGGGKGCFRHGKIGCAKQQQNRKDKRQSTVAIHNGITTSFL